MIGDCCVLKFLPGGVDGKHLSGFQSENAVFKFVRGGVDKAFVNVELSDINYRVLT